MGNKHVARSMHIMTTIEIGGEKIEANLDNFARLRFELARALRAAEKYDV